MMVQASLSSAAQVATAAPAELAAAGTTPRASIIVLSYNTREMLGACLASIAAHPPHTPWELIVVDDGSKDGSAELVARDFPWVRLAVNATNRGYAAANNVAFTMVRGEHVFLVNSDVIVRDPATFDTMIEFLDTHPEAGVAGQKLLNPDGSVQLSCRAFPTVAASWRQSFLPARWRRSSASVRSYYMADFEYDRVARVDMAAATCCIVRRKIIDEVGGFDEAFFLYVGDADWFYRIRARGHATYFLPDHPVIHHGGLSANPRRFYLIWDLHRGLYRFYRKHLARQTPWYVRPFVLPGIAVRFIGQALGWLSGRKRRICSDDFK